MYLYICELKVKKKINEKNKIIVKYIREINEDLIMFNVVVIYFLLSILCMNMVEVCIRWLFLIVCIISSCFMGVKFLLFILLGRGMFFGFFFMLLYSIFYFILWLFLGMCLNFFWNYLKCVVRIWRLWNWLLCI